MDELSFSFIISWHNTSQDSLKKFLLKVYPSQQGPNRIEIVDCNSGSAYLKKSVPRPQLSLSSLYVGSTITILSRKYKIEGCADRVTKERFGCRQRAGVRMPAHDLGSVGRAIHLLTTSGLALVRVATTTDLSGSLELVAELTGPYAQRVVALEDRVLAECEVLSGEETDEAFSRMRRTTARFSPDCTLAIIKPHAVASNSAGAILEAFGEVGLQMTAVRRVHLDSESAEKFLGAYREVINDYSLAVQELASGPCLALELEHRSGDAQGVLFRACGPFDVAIAKQLAPKSVRARWGKDRVLNAVHCTDLPAPDGQMESAYFFDVIQG